METFGRAWRRGQETRAERAATVGTLQSGCDPVGSDAAFDPCRLVRQVKQFDG